MIHSQVVIHLAFFGQNGSPSWQKWLKMPDWITQIDLLSQFCLEHKNALQHESGSQHENGSQLQKAGWNELGSSHLVSYAKRLNGLTYYGHTVAEASTF